MYAILSNFLSCFGSGQQQNKKYVCCENKTEINFKVLGLFVV